MPIDQSRPYEKRLDDFGKELGAFLGKVWKARAKIDLKDFEEGSWDIYAMYAGDAANKSFKVKDLKSFLAGMKKLAGKYTISPQGGTPSPAVITDTEIEVYKNDLWTDFYHVLSTPAPTKKITARVYVHAATSAASLELMTLIVGEFGKNKGLWEVKTCGPGSDRLDTIVAYLYDAESAQALVKLLNETAKKKAALFIDKLPPLVKREGPGIGSADEPPAIEIFKSGGTRHSFGSFFSALCWIALKTTPKVLDKDADGRHMLDNMLSSLRLLEVDPANPQRFPAAKKLEDWYQATKKA